MTVASGLSWLLACQECAWVSPHLGLSKTEREKERDAHLLDGAKDGEAEVFLACLLGADTSEELGTKLERLLAVEGGLFHVDGVSGQRAGPPSSSEEEGRGLTVFPLCTVVRMHVSVQGG